MKINKTVAALCAAALLVTGSAFVHKAFAQDTVPVSSETALQSVSDKEARAFKIFDSFPIVPVEPSDKTAEVYCAESRDSTGSRYSAHYEGKDKAGHSFTCNFKMGAFWEVTQEASENLTVYIFVNETKETAQLSLSRKTADGTDVYEYNYPFLCENGLYSLGSMREMSLERYTKEGHLKSTGTPLFVPDEDRMRSLIGSSFVNKEEVAAFLETRTFGPPEQGERPAQATPAPCPRSGSAAAKYQ
ncbi:MAG: hypothetical protein AB7S81_04875 [Bdellovibrionales bacterium]